MPKHAHTIKTNLRFFIKCTCIFFTKLWYLSLLNYSTYINSYAHIKYCCVCVTVLDQLFGILPQFAMRINTLISKYSFSFQVSINCYVGDDTVHFCTSLLHLSVRPFFSSVQCTHRNSRYLVISFCVKKIATSLDRFSVIYVISSILPAHTR